MPLLTRSNGFAWAAVGGLALGIAYTASPLTCWVLAAVPLLLHLAGRGLPASEQRALVGLLIAAFAARLVIVGGLFVWGLPWHNTLSVGALSGDEAYNLSRALRMRDALLGLGTSRYDAFVIFDDYGRSSYLNLLAALQVVFGPTPYSARLLNGVAFLAGAALLYRLARGSFGVVPALGGLTVLLFLPSLFHASISLLKESIYFLATAALLVSTIRLIRAQGLQEACAVAIVAGASLWLLDDLRRGALLLAVTGITLGLACRVASSSPRRALATLVLGTAGITAVLLIPDIQARAIRGVETAARIHSGHVFTVGHSYQLLDEGFYTKPSPASASSITLMPDQAVRFLLRSAVSFFVTPLPWEMRSLRQLAFLPEQLAWMGLVLLLPVGLVAGWRRDPLVTCVLTGYAVTIAAVVAVTTGNVGTLLRLRGLVSPYLLWFSVLGLCVLIESALRRAPASPLGPSLHAR